jgi:hypothetical protein
MPKLLVGFALSLALVAPACASHLEARFHSPAYYEANSYPMVEVRPGVRAYFIHNAWYVYEPPNWRAFRGRIVVRARPIPVQ